MNSVTIENYRCFRGRQTARLAPLTLLVGENSSGKTAFMAMIRALRTAAFGNAIPDFREPPYDLGAFEEVVYGDSRQSERAPDFFGASFEDRDSDYGESPVEFSVQFSESDDGFSFQTSRKFSQGDAWFELDDSYELSVEMGVGSRIWMGANPYRGIGMEFPTLWTATESALNQWDHEWGEDDDEIDISEHGSARFPSTDVAKSRLDALHETLRAWLVKNMRASGGSFSDTFAGAPARSQPQRNYVPILQSRDPEGEYAPSYLAMLSRRDPYEWLALKERLEDFGKASGLFDEISIGSLGEGAGDPFQVRIRKFGKELKGLDRNLIDVGYGVSQALPLLTELLRADAPTIFLLQQPEVHLHPMAQAALGSLFCSIANERQLIVETHSDYIVDRVSMDIRDKTTDLKPDDVSILFFERGELDARIHSLRLDDMGNVLDAPPSYREFFSAELTRHIGL